MKNLLFLFLVLSSISIQAQIITTIAGSGTAEFSVDRDPLASTQLNSPSKIHIMK